MIFSNFVKTESGNQVILKNNVPIENVRTIRFYKDDSSGSFDKKEFRWSFNNNYWSAWEVLNQGNLTRLDLKGKSYFFLEIRYIKANTSAKISSFSLTYESPTASTSEKSPCSKEYDDNCYTGTFPKDCETLNGQPGSYYLWRPNHKGQQPINTIAGLEAALNGKQGVIPDGTYLKESSLGDGFIWDPSGNLDVSILSMDYAYVDGSLNDIRTKYIPDASLDHSYFIWDDGLLKATGAQGVQGSQGTQGILGVQGAQGIQGEIGIQGLEGIQGTEGIQGLEGS
ncbi:MAG: collagen-like protein, partial [Candidatus Methanofastidiosa archaeon]|nr:collagen-like protein [Candidatus Methanofastidiosa archaeon]